MKPPFHVSRVACAIALLGALACAPARADIYTWVDARGNVNLSNRAPPEGTRVTNVYREDPAARASAEAARVTTQREELRALNERIKDLERTLDVAKRPAPEPVAFAPAVPPLAPYPSIVLQTVAPTPMPPPPTYADCADPWARCFLPGSFGSYPAGVVILNGGPSHRFQDRPGQHVPVPAQSPTHFPPMQAPRPVGALGDPPNLFPDTNRR
jgi:hypothetical protein